MFGQKLVEFFKDWALWHKVIAGLILMIVAAGIALLKRHLKRKRQSEHPPGGVSKEAGYESVSQNVVGDEATQQLVIGGTHQDKGIDINIAPQANVKITVADKVTVINYVDGLPQAENPQVRSQFEKAIDQYNKGKFSEAINSFVRCLELETEHKKRGALNLQIGNCYYEMSRYIKAAEFYATGLRESRKANDLQGEASSLISIANTYLNRPSSTIEARGENILKATGLYKKALEVFKKDEYPLDYAMTQNNLGNALTSLPAATTEERAKNVSDAIECYRAALEIRKKDEYPQYYCLTAANIGLLLASVDSPDSCYWLKEAYALREYLEDQGKRLEEMIDEVCK